MRTLLVFTLTASLAAAQASVPNVVLIVLDDLGTEKLDAYDGLHCEDSTVYAPTPQIDTLLAGGESILFTNAYVNPVCSPTRALVQSGRYGFRTGVGKVIGPNATTGLLADSEVLIPELLKCVDPSYRAGLFGKWHVTGHGNFCHPITNGYDVFLGQMANTGAGFDYFHWEKVGAFLQPNGLCLTTVQPTVIGAPGSQNPAHWNAQHTAQDAIAWITSLPAGTPYFASVNFNPPHAPLQFPPHAKCPLVVARIAGMGGTVPAPGTIAPAYDGTPATQQIRIDYLDAMIEAVDTEIGAILAAVDPADTMVVILGDNGTASVSVNFTEHDGSHVKGTVYQLGVRVPMIVSGPLVPFTAGGHHVVDDLVSGVDMWRTIARMTGMTDAQIDAVVQNGCGGSGAAGAGCDSLSFLDLVTDPVNATGARSYVMCEKFDPDDRDNDSLRCVTSGGFSLGCTPSGTPSYKFLEAITPTGMRHEFYDLDTEPRETSHLCPANVCPPTAGVFESLLDLLLASSCP
jgi:arylsulfatase A-like enzyme